MTSSSSARRPVPPAAAAEAAKASPYARFIPREELNAFAAWTLGDLSGGSASDPATAPREAPAPSEAAAPRADPAQLARQAGYQDGYRDGLVALEGFKQSFAHQTTLQLGTLVQSVGAQLDLLQQQMADAVSGCAIDLARQIVRSELAARPAAVARVAEEALDALLLSARHITLRLHPDDRALVAEGAADALASRGGRLVADPSIARGGCLVESDIGMVDASIETRWRRAVAMLGGDAPWALAVAPGFEAVDEPTGQAGSDA